MLQNAIRRAKISPSNATPFVCFFCKKNPLLTRLRPLSTATSYLKNTKDGAQTSANALETQSTLDDLRRNIREIIAKGKDKKKKTKTEIKRLEAKRDKIAETKKAKGPRRATEREKERMEDKSTGETVPSPETDQEPVTRAVRVRRIIQVKEGENPEHKLRLDRARAREGKRKENATKKAETPQQTQKTKSKAKGDPNAAQKKMKKAIKGVSLSAALGKKSKPPKSLENLPKLDPSDAEIKPINMEGSEMPPMIHHDLDRVLFNPGVHYLQDPRSRVYNFDPYLRDIMPVTEFDFNAVAAYITSSEDKRLENLAKELKKKYVGSTSSMTNVLSHFHFLLSHWRNINAQHLSKEFPVEYRNFTQLSRAPAAVFLRNKGDGTYAIDPDKEFDTDSILSLLGRSLEKMLTLPPENYASLRKSNAAESGSHNFSDKFHYSTLGDILMRSQLDAHDPRLPGTGMFDLKTRAVVSVRMDVTNFHLGSGYQIKTLKGQWESFEREYYDMIRAAFLKYSLQVRMGRMDGIFVAFHNTERIFGFQYVSLDEMDSTIHESWGSGIGEREFKLSLMLLNEVLNKATKRFPEKSLRLHFETRETQTPNMYIIAEPVTEEEIEAIQKKNVRDTDEFLKSLEQKRDSVKRKAEFKGIVEKFGEFEEPEVEVEAEKEESEGEASAMTEDVEGVTEEDDVTLVVDYEEGQQGLESSLETLSDDDENGEGVEPISSAIVIDETGSDNQGIDEETAQDDDDEDDEDDDEEEEEEEDREKEDEDEEEDDDKEDEIEEEDETEEIEEIEEEDTSNPISNPTTKATKKADTPEHERDLLAMTLTSYNFVNGNPVLRPTHLKPSDKWTIQYTIAESKSQERAWSTYNAVKKRRKKAVDYKYLAEDSDEVSQYVKYLRTLSKAGRTWAAEQEAQFQGTPVVYKGTSSGKSEGEKEERA